jgi:hypothetical protein
MQPNTQENSAKSAQGSNSEALPYAVPDYLGLEGASQKPKKTKIFFRLTLFLAPVTLLAVAGTLGYFYWQQNTPEALLYRALENSLKVEFVRRDIVLDNPKYKDVINIKVDSDFSKPNNPRSSLTYNFDGLKNFNKSVPGGSIAGEVVTIDEANYAGRIISSPIDLQKNMDLNKWYSGSLNKPSTKDPDVFGLYEDVNNPVSSLIIGNYGDKKAVQIVDLMKKSNIYKIQSTKSEKNDNDSVTRYYVQVDFQKLKNLIKNINNDLDLGLKPTKITSTNNIEILISNQGDRVIRNKEIIKQDDFQAIVDTRISYPENLVIKAPSDLNI